MRLRAAAACLRVPRASGDKPRNVRNQQQPDGCSRASGDKPVNLVEPLRDDIVFPRQRG